MTRRREVMAIGSLVGLPLVLFGVPALFGRLLVPGDDLIQNLPLRMLVGLDLRHGHLPLWDPFIWSGTPLLGGFNAGALQPLTLLFSFLPFALAWVLGEVITYALCGLGFYLFARRQGIRSLAAWLGAFAFTWSGFMATQINHLGLAEGMALSGWVLLGLDHLSRPGTGPGGGSRTLPTGAPDSAVLWSGVTGLAGGMVCLAGDPRAISNVAVVALVYGVWAFWRRPAGRRTLLAGGLVAAVLTLAVGLGQLLPGLAVQASSQRAGVSLAAFGAGSLAAPWLLFLAFPFALGGLGSLHLPTYSGPYILAEISSYVGLLAICGALAAAVSAGARWFRPAPVAGEPAARSGAAAGNPAGGHSVTPSGPADPPTVGVWVGLAVIGVFLALGSRTALGHLLVHIPLYRGQRLQSRNVGEVDLALALLFAGWVDGFLARAWAGPGGRWARRAALLPPLAVVVVVVMGLAWPGGTAHFLGEPSGRNFMFPRIWVFAVIAVVLAGGAAFILLRADRFTPRARTALVVAFVLVDVGFFGANSARGWASTSYVAAATRGIPPALAQVLPPGTRFVVVDPNLNYPAYVRGGSNQLPVPDLNLLEQVSSVQGYGSLVADEYETATGTHTEGGMEAAVVSGPLAARLDLGLVLIDPYDPQPAVQAALGQARWTPVGLVDGLMGWRNPHPAPAAFLVPSGAPATAPASSGLGTVSCRAPDPYDGSTSCVVRADGPARLERSEAAAPGWQATVQRSDPTGTRGSAAATPPAPARRVPVVDEDLIQSVRLPGPGVYVVRLAYEPSRDYAAIGVSGVGVLAALALCVVGWRRRGSK